MSAQDTMLTTEDVANYLKVDVVTVRRLVSRSELAAYRIGAEFRFTEADLHDYLQRQYMPVNSASLAAAAVPRPAEAAAFHIISNQILSRFRGGKSPRASSPAIGERFTERAVHALTLTQAAAEQQRCARIHTSHLLLGLAQESSGMASRALAELGITADQIKTVLASRPEMTGPARDSGNGLDLEPDVKRALEAAFTQAHKLSHDYLGTEHILLGLLTHEHNQAVSVLRELKVQPEVVRAKVLQLIKTAGN